MRICHHPQQFVRDRAQDRIERQVVPFRHDVHRRHRRVCRDVVVGVTEEVRNVEYEPGEQDAEHHHQKGIFYGRIGSEGDRIMLCLRLDAVWIVLPHHVQCPDVQDDDSDDHAETRGKGSRRDRARAEAEAQADGSNGSRRNGSGSEPSDDAEPEAEPAASPTVASDEADG